MSIYLVEPKQSSTNSLIYEFHRNNDGSSEIKVVENFKSYFFCDVYANVEQLDGVLRTEPGYTSINKTPLKKVYVEKSTFVKPIKRLVESMGFKHYEADIHFHNRYTIDLPEEIEKGNIKVCWLDIECAPDTTFDEGKDLDKEDPFPDIEKAEYPICCLTVKMYGVVSTWLCGPTDLDGTRYFPKEEDMLTDFMSFFYKESPDILSAWNLDFDLHYLIHRCKRLEIDVSRLSKTRSVYRKFMSRDYKTFGMVQLDLLEGYRLWRKYGNMPQLASYSLDFVAETVLNKKKLDHGRTMGYLWKNDVKTLIEYNQWDVELLDLIDKQCRVISFFDDIRRKCHIQFEDVPKTTAMIDGFLMNRLNKKIILPTAERNDEDKFEGAYVFPPTPGLYNNVLCLDIAAMYPSIIKNFNISYETVGGTDINLPIGISFSNEPGIIPMFMDELKKERDEYKLKRDEYEKGSVEYVLYDQRQYATKIIMNSFFGYLGYPGSRLYKKIVAGAITGMGKYILLEIAKWCEKRGK